jgi:dTDP-4-dehydrorhamnose reductase
VTRGTVLVFGRTGQVARELARLQPDAVFLGRAEADLSLPDTCAAAIANIRPSAVINAAAWTGVDRAESDEAAAAVINGDAPSAMAQACATLNIPIVHLSTDYVFDGSGDAPFAPDQLTEPLCAYGRTKLTGELGVIGAQGIHAVIRTSWVFSAQGANFVKTMVRLGREREHLSVVADQVGGPTSAAGIAEACVAIAARLVDDPKATGVYHFSGAPNVSWADFARAIMERAGLACRVSDILTSDYPTPARRPLNSRLDCASIETTFGLSRPDWRDGLDRVLAELGANG